MCCVSVCATLMYCSKTSKRIEFVFGAEVIPRRTVILCLRLGAGSAHEKGGGLPPHFKIRSWFHFMVGASANFAVFSLYNSQRSSMSIQLIKDSTENTSANSIVPRRPRRTWLMARTQHAGSICCGFVVYGLSVGVSPCCTTWTCATKYSSTTNQTNGVWAKAVWSTLTYCYKTCEIKFSMKKIIN